MELPKPGPFHSRLAALVGTWIGEEKMFPSPWAPQGMTASVRIVNRSACGGFWVVGDYEQRVGGAVSFEGHSVYGYDAARDEVVLHWFDSMGLGPDVFRGRFEGMTLTAQCTNPAGTHRLTHELGRPGEYVTRMETSADGDTWRLMLEGTYRRQA